MRNIAIVVAACLLQACLCGHAAAQGSTPVSGQVSVQLPDAVPPDTAFRLGPVHFKPTLLLVGPGVDTNVFNEYDQPQEDWTARAAPGADWWLKTGRGLFTASTALEYVYFQTFTSQRGFNGAVKAKYALSLGHIVPYLSGSYLNTRDRTGYEIDVRARHIEEGGAVGSEFILSNRTSFVAWGTRERFRYDEQDVFLGNSLSRALDRTTTGWHVEARRRIMSLTTLLVRTEGLQDRFDVAGFKDADSVSVKPGIQFKPAALINGEALVGYRSFRPLNPLVPEFRGLVASLDLAYTYSATRLAIRLSRDVQYSYEPTQPYYLQTDVTPMITQMITRNWDVSAGGSWFWLAYQPIAPLAGAPSAGIGRTDTGLRATAGVGRWFGRTLRIGVEGAYEERRSELPGLFSYSRLVAGLSVKYGLKP